ncbi:MAG TPA: hypothetical protein VMV06_00155, partial [Acidimicrobiales bacterium]|nr:hypothetical protein [Acidimicrobiales bacterium]
MAATTAAAAATTAGAGTTAATGTISTVYTDTSGLHPTGLDWSAGTLYLAENCGANCGAGAIRSLDTASPSATAQDIALADAGNDTFRPTDVVAAPDGTLYFTSQWSQGGGVYSVVPGSPVATLDSPLDMSESGALALDPSGRYLDVTASPGHGENIPILAFDTQDLAAGASALSGATLLGDGDNQAPLTWFGPDVYVTNMAYSGVYRYSSSSLTEITSGSFNIGVDPIEGALATAATFSFPSGIVSDAAGNLFVSINGHDGNLQVWEIYGPSASAPGTVHLVAGGGTTPADTAPAGTSATAVSMGYGFERPLTVDTEGNLYIGDSDSSFSSVVYKVAGVAAISHALTTTIATGPGDGTGTITCQVGAASPGPCGSGYLEGTTVTLTATPDAATQPVWSGCDTTSGSNCTVTMSGNRTVSVTFVPVLTVQVNPASTGSGAIVGSTAGSSIACGTGSDVCSEPVPYANGQPGAERLTALPDSSSYFAGWTNCDPNDSPADLKCTVTVDQSKTVYASFKTCPVSDCSPVTVTVGADPASTGSGQISGPDGGYGALACSPAPTDLTTVPAGCSAAYPYGAVVQLTAGLIGSTDVSSILGWNVPGCGAAQATCTVTVTRDSLGNTVLFGGTYDANNNPETITGPVLVKFGTGSYTLHVRVAGTGSVSLSPASVDSTCAGACDESYAAGATVVVTAHPGTGQSFAGWGPSCPSGGGNPHSGTSPAGDPTCTVVMTGGINEFTVDPTFAPRTYALTVAPGGSGTGTVTGSGVSCGTAGTGATTCGVSLTYGTAVTLTATPGPHSHVADWGTASCDPPGSGTSTCAVTITGTTFEPVTFDADPAVPTAETLTLAPATIQADGKATTTADVYVADQYGNPMTGQHIAVTGVPSGSTGGLVDVNIGAVQADAAHPGHYLATVAASTRTSQQELAASDADAPGLAPAAATVTLVTPSVPSTGGSQLLGTYTPDPSQPFTTTATVSTPQQSYTATMYVPAGALPAGTQVSLFRGDTSGLAAQLPPGQIVDGAIGLTWFTPGSADPTPPAAQPIVVVIRKNVIVSN